MSINCTVQRYKAAGVVLAAITLTSFFAENVRALPRSAAQEVPAAHSAKAESNADIYGHWRISRLLGAADIAAMSEGQARALIGKRADITRQAFIFNEERCASPSYERTREDLARSFREQGHVSAVGMGLPDPVTSIDAGCTHIFLKKPGVIVIHWDGFYFDAVRSTR